MRDRLDDRAHEIVAAWLADKAAHRIDVTGWEYFALKKHAQTLAREELYPWPTRVDL